MNDKLDEIIKESLSEKHSVNPKLNRQIVAMAKETKKVKKIKVHSKVWRVAVAAAFCFVVILSAGVTAYAADIGGFREKFDLWIDGEKKTATAREVYDGEIVWGDGTTLDLTANAPCDVDPDKMKSYVLEVEGEAGQEPVAIYTIYDTDADISLNEIVDYINEPNVSFNDDGSIVVYYYDQVIDITDQFEVDICCVELEHEGQHGKLYVNKMEKTSAFSVEE